MTAPRTRPRFAPTRLLVWAAACLLVPPALLKLVWAPAGFVILLLAGGLALMAAIDGAISLRLAGGVRLKLRPLTRLTLGRNAGIELSIAPTDETLTSARTLRIGVVAPALLGIDEPEQTVTIPHGTRGVLVELRARPRRRGSYRIGRVHLEVRSRFGLWHVRWAAELDGEIRVYPDLLAEGRRLAALFLRRPVAGWRLQRMVGRGRDFEKLREYLPGDGFDEIHWKATAKRGHPVTKVFQVERTQEIYAVIDASRMSARSAAPAAHGESADDTLLERQVNAALALALAAEKQGDLFGLATFTDLPRHFVRAKNGPAHFQACREALVRLQPAQVSPDFRDVCTFLRTRLNKRALLVFLTSLDDPAMAEAFGEAVALIAHRHLVVVAVPLPPDARPLFTGPAPETIDAGFDRLGGHMRWQNLQDLAATLHRHGVQLALLERDALAAGAVSHYMSLKQRQVI